MLAQGSATGIASRQHFCRADSGTSLKGDGTWRITGGRLVYRARANSDTSALTLRSATLTLSPDPVITKPGGTAGVETEYAWVK